MAISFLFKDTRDTLKEKRKIKSWIKQTVEKRGKRLGDISYIFSTDDYVLSINKQFLSHDYYTDIITFDYDEKDIVSGDIFISIDRIKDNSQKFATSFEEELHRVIIHGVLHLLGEKDKSEQESKKMREQEDKCLKNLTLL
jgi:probable rRNA maturation factor